jgi:hypothetical protein
MTRALSIISVRDRGCGRAPGSWQSPEAIRSFSSQVLGRRGLVADIAYWIYGILFKASAEKPSYRGRPDAP